MHAFRCHPFFRLGLFLILFATTHSSVIVQGASRPNVIVMITDDQGYGDFGFQGNPDSGGPPIWTPWPVRVHK